MARKSKVYYKRVGNITEARALVKAMGQKGFNAAFTNTKWLIGRGTGLSVYAVVRKKTKPKGFKTTRQEMVYI